MTNAAPEPFHNPMESELECDLANDRIAVLEGVVSAVDEFREYVNVTRLALPVDSGVVGKAKRAIAELKAERDAWHEQRDAEYEAWALAQAKVEELETELRDLTVEHCASGPWCESCGRITNEARNPAHPGQCDICVKLEKAEATIESLSAEKTREKHRRIAAEASARRWEARQRSTEQKLVYEEKELAALRADRTEILDSAWNTAEERAERAEADLAAMTEERDSWQAQCMENSKMLKEWERKKYAVSMTLDET